MARASLRDILYFYSFGDSMSTYGSTTRQNEGAALHTSGTIKENKSQPKSGCNGINTSSSASSSRVLHSDLSVNCAEELTSTANLNPTSSASSRATHKSNSAWKRLCTCKCYYFWCLLMPIPIVVVCIVCLISRCDDIRHDAVSLSDDTVLAARFKSCQSLATIQTKLATKIKAYSVDCSDLTALSYHQMISVTNSLHNVSVSAFAVYEGVNSSSYFADGVSSEITLNLRAGGGSKASVCHFTNYTLFNDFLRQDYSNATNCQEFIINADNGSDIHHYTSSFSFNASTYYFAGIRVIHGPVSNLHYNFTTERSYYNMSDFANGKFCHLSEGATCNISLPFHDTCLLINTENAYVRDLSQKAFHQFMITGMRESEKAKYIAAIVLCLLVLFYLLYLYIVVCSKYMCTKQ